MIKSGQLMETPQVHAAPVVTHGRVQPAPAPEAPGNPVTYGLDHPAQMAQPAQRPATNAERQAKHRAKQGDAYRAKNAARMRASRAKQRLAAECQGRLQLSAAS